MPFNVSRTLRTALLPLSTVLCAEFLDAAGLNAVPPLPEGTRSPTNSGTESASDFWTDFFNGPGGWTWNHINLQADINYKGFYTDNLFTGIGTPAGDFLHYVSPRVRIERPFESESGGTTLQLVYQPTFIFNTDNPQYDRTYQAVRGGINHQWGDKAITLDQTYQKTSEASTQSGFLAPQENNTTDLDYRTPLTGKINMDIGLQQSLSQSDVFLTIQKQSSSSWQGTAFATMDLLPKIGTGLGLSGGYTDQRSKTFAYQYFNERILTRWIYVVTGKLSFQVDAGLQLIQSASPGSRDPNPVPIFNSTLNYAIRYGTRVSLAAARTAGAAQFYGGQSITQTSVTLSAQQRIYEAFALFGGFGYQMGGYNVLDPSLTTSSHDYSSVLFSTELQWRINARASIGVFYQHLTRTSKTATDSISNNQIGVNVDLRF